MRVLITIADPAERLRWEGALRERGHLVVSARPGPEAWRHAVAGGLDLIVVGHEPGEGDARRLLAVLREIEIPPPTPSLLVLLPEEESGLLLTLLNEGADDVLIGTIEAQTLRLRLVAAEKRLERRHPGSATPFVEPHILTLPSPVPLPANLPRVDQIAAAPANLGPLAQALAVASAAAGDAYHALPGDPGAARADIHLVSETLRTVQQLVETLLGPLPTASVASRSAATRPSAPSVTPVAGAPAFIPSFPTRNAPPPPPSTLPQSPPVPAGTAHLPLPPDALRPLVVLAEDDEHVRRPLRRTLEHLGLEVLEAPDGETALRLILEHAARVRLVVTDHRMPRMTGGELVRELKRRLPHLPIVLVSGHGAEDIAMEAGADAYLRKPFQLVDLARTARRLLASIAA